MSTFLGIFPRLSGAAADDWDDKFMKKIVERDGFVPEIHRYVNNHLTNYIVPILFILHQFLFLLVGIKYLLNNYFSLFRKDVFGDAGSKCPFKRSPIESFKLFFSDSRHLVEELPNSPLGRLLGCSSLTSKSSDNNEDSRDEEECASTDSSSDTDISN